MKIISNQNVLDLKNYLSDGHSGDIVFSELNEHSMAFLNTIDRAINVIRLPAFLKNF